MNDEKTKKRAEALKEGDSGPKFMTKLAKERMREQKEGMDKKRQKVKRK